MQAPSAFKTLCEVLGGWRRAHPWTGGAGLASGIAEPELTLAARSLRPRW